MCFVSPPAAVSASVALPRPAAAVSPCDVALGCSGGEKDANHSTPGEEGGCECVTMCRL